MTVIVPAKNEAPSIPAVLAGSALYADELIVVDGHSTDSTRDEAKRYDAKVMMDNGRGKGDAVRLGIREAKGDYIVLIDADGSHDPSDIPKLLKPLLAGDADMVVGSRPKGGSDELHGDLEKFARMIGSDIITLAINYRFGVRLSDSQNGFRALTSTCAKALDLKEDITTIEQEMIIKALHSGFRIVEVPTHEYARKHGRSTIDLKKVAFRYVWSAAWYLLFGGGSGIRRNK